MKKLSFLLNIGIYTLSYLFAKVTIIQAQVIPDNTVDTQVNQTDGVAEITGGATRGENLFHSFQEFSIPAGSEAFFNNATNIENIFSRVTGQKISNIDGLIRANGSANLFLINPAGIIFGEGARLDIGGSFYGSTANSILFEDGEFSATDLDNTPLLTINAPIGLDFRDNSGNIEVNTADGGLEVGTGQKITLLGGDISFDGGKLFAPGGIINLGGLTQAGEIAFNGNGGLAFPENIARGDVSLNNSARVSILSNGGGAIFVNAKVLELSEQSELIAGIAEDAGDANTVAGDINIDATDVVRLIGADVEQTINNRIRAEGIAEINAIRRALGQEEISENAGFIVINQAREEAGLSEIRAVQGIDTSIRNYVGLPSNRRNNPNESSSAEGNGGKISINTNLLEITNRASIDSLTYGRGDAGEIRIDANKLSLSDRGLVRSDTLGNGNAGNIKINAINAVSSDGEVNIDNSSIISLVALDAVGNGGEVRIDTNKLSLTNGGLIASGTLATGNAGNIKINATNAISLDDSRISSRVIQKAVGNGGEVRIDTNKLSLTNGAQIQNNTRVMGNAGSIYINAVERVSLDGENGDGELSIITSSVEPDAIGNGGNVRIDTNKLSLTNGAKIQSTTSGTGDGNTITINALDTISLEGTSSTGEGSAISTSLEEGAIGNTGKIKINSKNLFLSNRAFVSSSNLGENTADLSFQGEGESIDLNVANNIVLEDNSFIAARAVGDANGGNLNISANFLLAIFNQNNDIIANAERGNGGKIDINAESVFGIEERSLNRTTNDINASSEVSSLEGSVNVNGSDINPVRGASELPTNVIEIEETTQQVCKGNRELAAKNRLDIAGKGGVPANPRLPMNSYNSYINGKADSTSRIPKNIETSQGKIQPARGIIVNDSGEVILTAYRTENVGDRILSKSINCG